MAPQNPKQLQAEEYAISTVSFGKIFHAYGPQASQVGSLEEAKQLVSDLYYNMLCKATQDKMQLIVLAAISTGIFAGGGPGFTKQEFTHTAYTAMIQGIDKFQQQHPNHALKIIVNMWDTNVVKQVQALKH
ncbi:MAG: macro domain-containing protein [Bacteroidota bacterium]